ncbi:MAG: hypothetical protein GEU86_01635 [Actinophytocola sp.]|nr:hypothetical protein [Actinophytocola sp.]
MMATPDPEDRLPRGEVAEEHPPARLGIVRIVNGLISVVTGVFAAVLAIHIVLVVGEANMGNPFAQFITNWADAVNLGLNNLFTIAGEKGQVALNEGLAALLWLVIGAVLTTIIARVLVPDTGSRVWYRRTVH